MMLEQRNPVMTLLSFFYRHGLWLSWPFLLLGLFLLGFFILTLARMGDKHRVCALPLTAEQTVEFKQGGVVVLWLEGPLLTSRFSGLSFGLTGSDGSLVKGRRPGFPLRSSSFSRARFNHRVFTLPAPGCYKLNTKGLGAPRPTDEDHELVFMRPYGAMLPGYVLGILLGSFLTIGSLVNFLLRLLRETN